VVINPPIYSTKINFENVPPLGDTRTRVFEDGYYIHQILGPPTFVDATTLGSYAHRPCWIWTNLAPSHVLTTSLSKITRPTRCKVVDILNDHRVPLDVSKDDESLLACVNKLGAPRVAFPTFVTYLGSFAFQARGLCMV